MRVINYKSNCLNTFRLLAAIEVAWIHCLTHFELSNVPVIGDIICFFYGVPIFLTLSGFLIWNSIGNSHSFKDYSKKRFWRIFPELWVAVAVEIIVLLALYKQPIDWPKLGLFAIGQGTVFQFWTPDFLRGYGCGCPNGSLWTISVLIQFYFLAYFIYKYLHKGGIYVWGAVLLFSVLLEIVEPWFVSYMPTNMGKLYSVSIFPYLWMFLIASFIAEHRDKVLAFLMKYWWVIIIVLIANRSLVHLDFKMNSHYALFDTILLFCGILGFAYRYPALNIKTDISYGVYIYHMTIVNALLVLGFVGQKWTLWAVLLISVVIAWISTISIGKFSKKMKGKLK